MRLLVFVFLIFLFFLLYTTMVFYDNVQQPVTVIKTEDVVRGKYYFKLNNATWVNSSHLAYISASGVITLLNVNTAHKSVLHTHFSYIYKFSVDGRRLLVSFQPTRVYRNTILARYGLVDMHTGESSEVKVNQADVFQNGVVFNGSVFLVAHNDVYAIVGGKEYRLSFDGSDVVFNGVADWVYEEEVLTESSSTIWPSTSHVVYLTLNDSAVRSYEFPVYGDGYSDEYKYPGRSSVRYPKAGTVNPDVSFTVLESTAQCFALLDKSCVWKFDIRDLMSRVGVHDREEWIFAGFIWDGAEFVLVVMNRVQNERVVVACHPGRRVCNMVMRERKQNGWIDVSKILAVGDGDYLAVTSVREENGLEYAHVERFNRDVKAFVTHGTFSVDEIMHYHDNVTYVRTGLLDLSSMSVNDSTQSHVYALKDNVVTCVTCDGCTFNTLVFYQHRFVRVCESESAVPVVAVYNVNRDGSTTRLMELNHNGRVGSALSGVYLPSVVYTNFGYSVGKRNYTVRCKFVGPSGWDSSSSGAFPKRTLPVLVDVYGGPNSQKVTKRFQPNDWSYALASRVNMPVVYVTIDGIGSGRESNSMAFEVYRNLGNHEVVDKIHVVREILSNYPALNPTNVAVWGWSYGGYSVAMLMGKDTDVFSCGVAVAPVVNWNLYDTIYTERYMLKPEDNEGGYGNSSVLKYTDNFNGKKFMLVHGNADDNVHYQQSMLLARNLQQKGIVFYMQSYPDENHSLGGVRTHLFSTLENFLFNICYV